MIRLTCSFAFVAIGHPQGHDRLYAAIQATHIHARDLDHTKKGQGRSDQGHIQGHAHGVGIGIECKEDTGGKGEFNFEAV